MIIQPLSQRIMQSDINQLISLVRDKPIESVRIVTGYVLSTRYHIKPFQAAVGSGLYPNLLLAKEACLSANSRRVHVVCIPTLAISIGSYVILVAISCYFSLSKLLPPGFYELEDGVPRLHNLGEQTAYIEPNSEGISTLLKIVIANKRPGYSAAYLSDRYQQWTPWAHGNLYCHETRFGKLPYSDWISVAGIKIMNMEDNILKIIRNTEAKLTTRKYRHHIGKISF